MKKIIGIIAVMALLFIMGCSDDNGTSPTRGWSWQERVFAPPASLSWTVIAASADAAKLYAGGTESYVYTSHNSGQQWTSRLPGGNWNCLATSNDGTKLIGGLYPGSLYHSTDSGVNWSVATIEGSNEYWTSAASSSDGSKLIVGQYEGYLYTSTDTGATWTRRDPTGGAELQDTAWEFVTSSDDGLRLSAGLMNGKVS